MNKVADYQNGNTHVVLYEDGTRVMESEDDEFRFDFPLNIDVTISHRCTGGCEYCYLGCTPTGKQANLLGYKFFDSLHPGTEMAININSFSHNNLVDFLIRMKDRGVFVNATVSQDLFELEYKFIKALCNAELLRGIGVSLHRATYDFIDKIHQFQNAVVHVINGILTHRDLVMLSDEDLKILILGYKDRGRGVDYHKVNDIPIKINMHMLRQSFPVLFTKFKVVAFDNAALEQLQIRDFLTDEEWETYYEGDEGSCTMNIDLVTGKFSQSSLITDPSRVYPIMDTVEEMFNVIKNGG